MVQRQLERKQRREKQHQVFDILMRAHQGQVVSDHGPKVLLGELIQKYRARNC